MTTAVALYLRSSKEKHDVSIPAQRRELQTYAKAQGWTIAAEYSDVQISGSLDEISRPGLLEMLRAVGRTARGWDTLLLLDTSRLARDPVVSLYVQRECNKAGVTIVYAKTPLDSTSPEGEMMLSMMQTFDRMHSRISAAKGVLGQRENLANGWRAGGRKPYGYELVKHKTGGTRSGEPITKSKLVLNPKTAPLVKRFMRLRAAGTARRDAAIKAGMPLQAATLIGIERNALTYAGYLVWNTRRKHKPTRDDPRKTMIPRPRAEWHISERPVYPALITKAEAETILANLAARSSARGRKVGETAKPGVFLLAGIMQTPDGTKYQGDGRFYRAGGKGARVLRSAVDALVLETMTAELQDTKWIGKAVKEAHAMAAQMEDNSDALQTALRNAHAKIARLADVVASTGNATLVGKLEELERQRDALQAELASKADRAKLKAQLAAFTPEHVHAMLTFFPLSPKAKPEAMRRTIQALVRHITLDPTPPRTVQIEYLFAATPPGNAAKKYLRAGPVGFGVASPRGFEPLYSP